MRPRKRAAGVALAAVVAAALLPTVQAGAAAGSADPGRRIKAQTPSKTVTLITGDRVTVSGDRHAVVERGPGREKISFITSRAGGRLKVIPADTLPALQAGRLDPRLFDVTGLIEFGYDDKRSTVVPLILTGSVANRTGLQQVRTVLRGTAVHAAKANVGGLWKSLTTDHAKVWLDGKRKPHSRKVCRTSAPRTPGPPGSPALGSRSA